MLKYGIIAILMVGLVGILVYGKLRAKNNWDFVKDVLVPLLTPAMVAIFGIWLSLQQESQQKLDGEIQQQGAIMKEIISSRDRQEAAFLLTVDTELMAHVMRYQTTDSPGRDFDAEAIFFFYGLHRADLVNLSASKGVLLFPRLWIQDAFFTLAEHIVTNVLGAGEFDQAISPQSEAVIYKYFTQTPNDTKEKATPLLIDFHAFCVHGKSPLLSTDEAEVLKAEFLRFKDRLAQNKIDTDHLNDDVLAMNGLFDYSFNYMFADWYRLPKNVRSEIPAGQPIPEDPPRLFMLTYGQFPEGGTNAWKHIVRTVNYELANNPEVSDQRSKSSSKSQK